MTYYVVNNGNIITKNDLLLSSVAPAPFIKKSFATLKNPSLNFNDASSAKKIIRLIKGKSGIYLWTHKSSGRQYVGSGGDLFNRLEDYFQNSQLISQAKNSHSEICKAILKYGLSSFSLAIQILDSSESFLKLEQFYLDNYIFNFNIRRVATPTPHAYNPSGKLRKPVYIYNSSKNLLLKKCETVTGFQLFSGLNGTQLKLLILSNTKLWRNMYFISDNIILEADNLLSNEKPFVPVPSIGSKKTHVIYAYTPGNALPLIFDSQTQCARKLGGAPKTLLKCLNNNLLFKGYRVSRLPLLEPFNE